MAAKNPKQPAEPKIITIRLPQREKNTVLIVGTTPLITERMSMKAKNELLNPDSQHNVGGRKNKDTANIKKLKHDPLWEMQESIYRLPDDERTIFAIKAASFKKAMMTAATDQPDVTKAQIGRLVQVTGEWAPLYGIPQMVISVVRQSGMTRAPDMRTRAIFPRWATIVNLDYQVPTFATKSIMNLLALGGIAAGIGGWRTEKGSGTYGCYRLTDNAEDEEFLAIMAESTKEAQEYALLNPAMYDQDTLDLFDIFCQDCDSRDVEYTKPLTLVKLKSERKLAN